MRKRLIISLLLIIALLSFYAALPRLAEQAVIATLQPYGVEVDRFDLEHPGWNRVLIRNLQLHQNTADYSLQLDSSNVEAHFSLLQLFRQTEIEQFIIGNTDIRLKLHPQPSEDSTTVLPPLPSQILKLLPASRIRVKQYSVHTDLSQLQLPGLPPQISLTGALELSAEQFTTRLQSLNEFQNATLALVLDADNQDRIRLNLTLDDAPLLESQLQLTPATDRITVTSESLLDLSFWRQIRQHPLFAGMLAQPYIPQQLPEIAGQLIIDGTTELHISPDQSLSGEHHYQLRSELQLLQPARLLDQSPLDIQRANLTFGADLNIDPQKRIEMIFSQLEGTLQKISYQSPEGQFSSDEQSLSLVQPATVSSHPDQLPQIDISDIELLLKGTEISFDFQQQKQPDSKSLTGQLRFEPVPVTLTGIDLQKLSAAVNLPKIHLTTQTDSLKIPTIQLSSQIDLQPEQISQRFKLKLLDSRFPDGQIDITGRSKTDLQTQISSGYWQAEPINLSRIDKLARSFVSDLPPELVINGGTLNHQGWFDHRSAGLALRLLNRADNLNLNYDQTRLFDTRWQSETLQRHTGQLTDTGELEIGFIDLGLPLQDFRSSYRLRRSAAGQQQLDINSSTVRLLGGELTTLPVSFDPAQPDIETAVALTHLDLAELIALEQQRGLSGAGTLNGQMPVRFVDNQLTVTNGQILSTPEGGWIRFDPPPEFRAMAQANPALSIAFDALENLQYDSLGIELDYLADGTALLKTHLKGNNPDWNNGQPVDFTVNIEENLPKLIQALQFTDKLTETIEKRYR